MTAGAQSVEAEGMFPVGDVFQLFLVLNFSSNET